MADCTASEASDLVSTDEPTPEVRAAAERWLESTVPDYAADARELRERGVRLHRYDCGCTMTPGEHLPFPLVYPCPSHRRAACAAEAASSRATAGEADRVETLAQLERCLNGE